MSDFGLLSIIVTVYNTNEVFLKECIDSIIAQSYSNIEVIVVDGSDEDNSSFFACYKSTKIYYIKIINHGPGYARNIGIKKSNGNFITFIDSDDIIASNYSECLIDCFKDDSVDVAIGWYDYLIEENGVFIKKNNNLLRKKINKITILEKDLFFRNVFEDAFDSVHCKIFKRESIGDCLFEENILIAEDIAFNYSLLPKLSFSYVDGHLYYYRIHSESITTTFAKEKYNYLRYFLALYKTHHTKNHKEIYYIEFLSSHFYSTFKEYFQNRTHFPLLLELKIRLFLILHWKDSLNKFWFPFAPRLYLLIKSNKKNN